MTRIIRHLTLIYYSSSKFYLKSGQLAKSDEAISKSKIYQIKTITLNTFLPDSDNLHSIACRAVLLPQVP